MRMWRRLLTCGFSKNMLERLPFLGLGQFFARRRCSSTSSFMMKKQPQILALRQVKNGLTILSAGTEFDRYVSQVDDFQPFVDKLHDLMKEKNLQKEQIYNADETGLFWRVLPDKTLAGSHEKDAPGVKKSKDRVTLLCCANATGTHKLKPVLKGKYKKLRCFKRVDTNAFPANYTAQTNAWMDTDIFTHWFHEQFTPAVKQHLRLKGLPCTALLLIDNCSVHPEEEELCSSDGNIKQSSFHLTLLLYCTQWTAVS